MAAGVYFTIADSDGDTSTFTIWFPSATPAAVLIAAVPVIAQMINPLLNGGLKSAGVTFEVNVAGVFGPVAALIADVQEKGEFVMRTVGGFISRLNLPTFDENFFVPGTGIMDESETEVAVFLDFLEDGITVSGTLIQPTDYREDDIQFVEKAVENWGRRRNK